MEWRSIKEFEGIYEISDTGVVKRCAYLGKTPTQLPCYYEEHFLKPYCNKKGYLRVQLTYLGKVKTYLVHRLVAEAFIPNPNNLPQVNHIDCDKTNNHVENLEWCTNLENQRHARAHGLVPTEFEHPHSKLTYEQVMDIKVNCVKGKRGAGMLNFAKKYNVCCGTIQQILKGNSYKNVH